MKHYTHLTSEQRYQISNGLKEGCSQQTIAAIIGVNKSTISREIRRNDPDLGRVKRRIAGAGTYRPAGAHKQAVARRVGKSKARISQKDWPLIEWLLYEKWSPEQISLWLGSVGRLAVSHEWIYQHIRDDKHRGGLLYKHLRCQKKRRKRYGSKERRGSIPNRVSIEQRPAVVEQRARNGDWELDTVYGKNKGHDNFSGFFLKSSSKTLYKSCPLLLNLNSHSLRCKLNMLLLIPLNLTRRILA